MNFENFFFVFNTRVFSNILVATQCSVHLLHVACCMLQVFNLLLPSSKGQEAGAGAACAGHVTPRRNVCCIVCHPIYIYKVITCDKMNFTR